MAVATNLFRRGAVYYFRRRVRWSDGSISAICISLRTRRLAEARRRATLVAACCEEARAMFDACHSRFDLWNPPSVPDETRKLSLTEKNEIVRRQIVITLDGVDRLKESIRADRRQAEYPHKRIGEWIRDLPNCVHFCQSALSFGLPYPGQFRDMEDLRESGFCPDFDLMDQIQSCNSPNSLASLLRSYDHGSDSALRALDIPCSYRNKIAACMCIVRGQLEALQYISWCHVHSGLTPSDPALRNEYSIDRAKKRKIQRRRLSVDWPMTILFDVAHDAVALAQPAWESQVYGDEPDPPRAVSWEEWQRIQSNISRDATEAPSFCQKPGVAPPPARVRWRRRRIRKI